MSPSRFSRTEIQPATVGQIFRTITVSNDKGGVGKTSFVANVAALIADAGHRVLVIDLDPQANLNRDFGYAKSDGSDLLYALQNGTPMPILENVRPNLDVVAGGREIRVLQGIIFAKGGQDHILPSMLYASLSAVAEPYDLILIDTAPGDPWLVEAALAVSFALLIITGSDDASFDGLDGTAERFVAARALNPDLELAGAVIFGVGDTTRRIARETREVIEGKLGGVAPVFRTSVRHQLAAAKDARKNGQLIHELEGSVSEAARSRLQALKEGRKPEGSYHASNVSGLLSDYSFLAEELLERILELEAGQNE